MSLDARSDGTDDADARHADSERSDAHEVASGRTAWTPVVVLLNTIRLVAVVVVLVLGAVVPVLLVR